MTNIWIDLRTLKMNICVIVNLLVIRFITDISCRYNHKDRYQNFHAYALSIFVQTVHHYHKLNYDNLDFMFNWDFFLNGTNLWLWNNGHIRKYYVCQCFTVPEIQWNGCWHSWTHAHFAFALAVSHNITMGREGSPTIQTGPFYLASHEWECHEDKWNRQGEFSCFS